MRIVDIHEGRWLSGIFLVWQYLLKPLSKVLMPVIFDDSFPVILAGFSLFADVCYPVRHSADSLGRKNWSKRAGR